MFAFQRMKILNIQGLGILDSQAWLYGECVCVESRRIRENSDAFPGIAPNSGESGYRIAPNSSESGYKETSHSAPSEV